MQWHEKNKLCGLSSNPSLRTRTSTHIYVYIYIYAIIIMQLYRQLKGEAYAKFTCNHLVPSRQIHQNIIARRGRSKWFFLRAARAQVRSMARSLRDAEEKPVRWLAAVVCDEAVLLLARRRGLWWCYAVLSGALISKQPELGASCAALGGGDGRCKQRTRTIWYGGV